MKKQVFFLLAAGILFSASSALGIDVIPVPPPPAQLPEPGTWLLLGSSVLGLWGFRRLVKGKG